ncbi:MAG: glycoside hydrolase family 3 N-terminal domain-containing protein [Thermoanaerobaculia bacterium]
MKGGGVLFLGFEGRRLGSGEARILRRVRPAGIVLVTRNIGEEEELRELTGSLRRIVPDAIFCLDAEGGRVDRLRAIAGPSPSAAALGRRPPVASRRSGRLVGAAVRRFDFDLDFAPVADLDYGRVGNALDERTFGSSPRSVTARARAFAGGLHDAGVGSCVKHFPGLGDAPADTHFGLAEINLAPRELRRALQPFRDLFDWTTSAMVSHAVYPGWGESVLPASLSRRISHGLLRGESGYRKALFSDDLEMGALGGYGTLPEIAELALVAGCDGLLFCRRLEEAPAIAERLAHPALSTCLRRSVGRLARLRRDLARLRR